MTHEIIVIGIIAAAMLVLSGVTVWSESQFRKIQRDSDEAWRRRSGPKDAR